MEPTTALAIDVGGTKIAWGVIDVDGRLLDSGSQPTPMESDAFVASLQTLVREHPAPTVGIGIAGTLTPDHQGTELCTNLPHLSQLPLVSLLKEAGAPMVALDNDGRCALIGEVWLGAAAGHTSAVLMAIGTGVGGGVMQKGKVLPHPSDVMQELGRIMVDQSDRFPAASGSGTIEAFIGGNSLADRLDINMRDISADVRRDDPEAQAVWKVISDYFAQCIRAVHEVYSCKVVIIAGKGSKDLEYYVGRHILPCTVIAAALGENAQLYGAARLALDLYDENQADWE
jgi:glucokinase